MSRQQPFLTFLTLGVILGALPSLAQEEAFQGYFHVSWGDTQPGAEHSEVHQRLTLATEDGQYFDLRVPPELLEAVGGADLLNNRYVELSGYSDYGRSEDPAIDVTAIWYRQDDHRNEGRSSRMVTGSKPWISVGLKFSDKSAEPRSIAYFQDMYDNIPGRLDHYWREVSHGHIDVVGSTAVGWFDLPQPQNFYSATPGSGSNANLTALFNDSIAAADPTVDFSNNGTGGFEGINLMFNDRLDCCAWGGARFSTIDGVSRTWRVTWEPPWGYADIAVMCHEMGHGFGLPHSNNTDGDSNPYDSPWDVMSSATGATVRDGVYGRRGKHTNAYHKDRLGWIVAAEQETVNSEGLFFFDIDPTAQANTSNLRMVKVLINGSSSNYYTIEVRDPSGTYEGNLPGKAVILHEVRTSRNEPSWVLDSDNPPANFANTEGCMWRVGEQYEDAANKIRIEVMSQTTNGFRIMVDTRPCDNFNFFFTAVEDWPNGQTVLNLVQALECPGT